MIPTTLIILNCLLMVLPNADGGVISGVVVNASTGKTPVAWAKVVLRVEHNGESSIHGDTLADDRGRFAFQNLPQGSAYWYIAGANRDGVHYPGPRVQLSANRLHLEVEVPVCDSITAPSPLVIHRQDVAMCFQSGLLSVTESMIVDNPSKRCYVGETSAEDGEPITMQLAIPSNFERTTFQQEFFGRRFVLLGDKLVTSVPWQPGRRELKFTYTLPIKEGVYRWERPLDLPCEQFSVSIENAKPEDVSCNLAAARSETPGELVYQSTGELMPKGRIVRVEMGRLPVPLMAYARWLALALLIFLFLNASGVIFIIRWRKRNARQICDNNPHKKALSSKKNRPKMRV